MEFSRTDIVFQAPEITTEVDGVRPCAYLIYGPSPRGHRRWLPKTQSHGWVLVFSASRSQQLYLMPKDATSSGDTLQSSSVPDS